VGLVEIVILGDVFEMKSLVPSAFLLTIVSTFSLIFVEITIWFRDLLREIFVTESSDCDGLW
jgi:hypothetical protein